MHRGIFALLFLCAAGLHCASAQTRFTLGQQDVTGYGTFPIPMTQSPSSVFLTNPGQINQTSSLWTTAPQDISTGFIASFSFVLTPPQTVNLANVGAGFAFVVRSTASQSPTGATASGLGYSGLPGTIAVEFDTHLDPDVLDVNGNHVSVHANGTYPNTALESPPFLLPNGLVSTQCGNPPQQPCIPNMKDGNQHTVTVRYSPQIDPYRSMLEVFLDYTADPVLRVQTDLQSTLGLTNGQAYIGFTSSTGPLGWETQTLTSFSLVLSPDLNAGSIPAATIALVVIASLAGGSCIILIIYRIRRLSIVGKGYQPLAVSADDDDDSELDPRKGESERVSARLFLRGSRDYSPQEVLVDVGHRRSKPCMVVKHEPSSQLRMMAITAVPKKLKSLLANTEQQQRFVRALVSAVHPYLDPPTDIQFSADLSMIYIFRHFRADGSLRDFLYRAKPRSPFRSKYRGRAEPLTGDRMSVFGRHVLEGMIALRSAGYPSLIHVNCANVLIHNKIARISDFENCPLGFKPAQLRDINGQVKRLMDRTKAFDPSIESVTDTAVFGKLLFEMATGSVMQGPSLDNVGKRCNPEVLRILQAIFNPERAVPALSQLLSLPFFQTAKMPALPQPIPDPGSLFKEVGYAPELFASFYKTVNTKIRATEVPGSFSAALRLQNQSRNAKNAKDDDDDDDDDDEEENFGL